MQLVSLNTFSLYEGLLFSPDVTLSTLVFKCDSHTSHGFSNRNPV